MEKQTIGEFIEKAKTIHGEKYDYSLVNYVGSKIKIKIICPIHGEFEQIPNSHLKGINCYKCSRNYVATDEFIEKAKTIHGEKYDYSLVNYKNNKIKIKIICPIHGEFEQIPNSHLKGCGCPKCVGKYKTTDEFIEKAKTIHGEKYDYSLVNYISVFKQIKIICSIHGEFEQTPNSHLKGCGCPKCKESKGEKIIRDYLTKNNIKFIPQHKFDDCKDIKPLPFDFYLPEYNTCIEYDGRQHFEIIDRWGGVNGLIDQQNKDKIKTDYCFNNKIKLLRISHKESIYNKLIKI
jgi:hypothetical protein